MRWFGQGRQAIRTAELFSLFGGVLSRSLSFCFSLRISSFSPYQLFLPYQSLFPYPFVLSVSVCPLRISCSYRISFCHDARLLRHSLASWHKLWQLDVIPVTTQEYQPKLLRRGNSISQNSCVVATPCKPINRKTAN